MTIKNIQAGFKYTGIYPLNRDAIVPSRNDATSTLAQRTGLKFIPLATRRYRPPITQEAVFTEEEESRFQKGFKKVMILLLMIVITNGKKASIK